MWQLLITNANPLSNSFGEFRKVPSFEFTQIWEGF